MNDIAPIRLQSIDHEQRPDDPEKVTLTRWAAVCQRVYDILQAHDAAHPETSGEITPVEPHGAISGVFEWRAYWHPAQDGPGAPRIAYVAIRDITEQGPR